MYKQKSYFLNLQFKIIVCKKLYIIPKRGM